MKSRYSYQKFTGIYLSIFFATGTLLPLLSLYLESLGLTGRQIGITVSINSLMAIFIPPMWAIISDVTHKHKAIFIFLLAGGAIVAIIMPYFTSFTGIIFILVIYYLFITPLIPLLDSLTLKSNEEYGRVRKWGAVGFALASYIVSFLVDRNGFSILFIVLSLAFVTSIIFTFILNVDFEKEAGSGKKHFKALLANKDFILFLLFIFFVGGTITSNNYYMGLYLKSIGASTTLIGVAFFLFTISEVPLMQLTNRWLKKHNVEILLIGATVFGIIRWVFYALKPSPILIVIFFALQGMFYGAYLVGCPVYIKENVPAALRSTSTALYSAIGFGVSGILVNTLCGYIYDLYDVKYIYYFYTLLCSIGLVIILLIHNNSKKRINSN